MNHEHWMGVALNLAREAATVGEVPVGAVVVVAGEVVGSAYNQTVGSHDPTGHAEIRALREAGRTLANYRLPGATLYVTIEPCTMCAGALVHARVGELVFGAREPRSGAVMSTASVLDNAGLNHRVVITEGVLATECALVITDFFAAKRSV